MERFQKRTGTQFFTVNTQPVEQLGKLNTECIENVSWGGQWRRMDSNRASIYLMQPPSFPFRLSFLDSQPCLERPLFQVRASIITLRNDDEESRVTRQAYLICSTRFKCRGRANISMFVFDGLLAWLLWFRRVSRSRVIENEGRFYVHCICCCDSSSNFYVQEKQLVWGAGSFAYYELSTRENRDRWNDSSVNHTDLSENAYKYWGGYRIKMCSQTWYSDPYRYVRDTLSALSEKRI